MRTYVLVRHAETEWNQTHRFQGTSDVPLSEVGRQQAQRLSDRLQNESFDAIFTSDLSRACETAQIIAAPHSLDPIQDPFLQEMNFGLWEGMTYKEIKDQFPLDLNTWEEGWIHTTPPEGEGLQDVVDRIQSFRTKISEMDFMGKVLITAHKGPLQCLLSQLMGLGSEFYWQFDISTASITEIRCFRDGAILGKLNDTCHLEELNES